MQSEQITHWEPTSGYQLLVRSGKTEHELHINGIDYHCKRRSLYL